MSLLGLAAFAPGVRLLVPRTAFKIGSVHAIIVRSGFAWYDQQCSRHSNIEIIINPDTMVDVPRQVASETHPRTMRVGVAPQKGLEQLTQFVDGELNGLRKQLLLRTCWAEKEAVFPPP